MEEASHMCVHTHTHTHTHMLSKPHSAKREIKIGYLEAYIQRNRMIED